MIQHLPPPFALFFIRVLWPKIVKIIKGVQSSKAVN
jgi:hypothetical protein